MLLDRRKVKLWQKIVFGFMAFLMAAFLVVGYSGVIRGCDFGGAGASATQEVDADVKAQEAAVAATPDDAAAWAKLGEHVKSIMATYASMVKEGAAAMEQAAAGES